MKESYTKPEAETVVVESVDIILGTSWETPFIPVGHDEDGE